MKMINLRNLQFLFMPSYWIMKYLKYIIPFILGLIVYHFLFKPEVKTEIVETIRTETDTVFIHSVDTIQVTNDRIITEYLRDTIINQKPINLSRFKGLEPHLYGSIGYSGIVAGEVISIGIITDFKIPKVTNTIYKNRTITRTIESGGSLYGGVTGSTGMELIPNLSYQNKGWHVEYGYGMTSEQHFIGVKRKIF